MVKCNEKNKVRKTKIVLSRVDKEGLTEIMCVKDLKEVGEQALIIPKALRQEHAGMFQKQQGDHQGG